MINTLERLVILVVAVVGLVFVYGTLSMAWAECDAAKPATLYIVTNGFLKQKGETLDSPQACRNEGRRLESEGKIREYWCVY